MANCEVEMVSTGKFVPIKAPDEAVRSWVVKVMSMSLSMVPILTIVRLATPSVSEKVYVAESNPI